MRRKTKLVQIAAVIAAAGLIIASCGSSTNDAGTDDSAADTPTSQQQDGDTDGDSSGDSDGDDNADDGGDADSSLSLALAAATLSDPFQVVMMDAIDTFAKDANFEVLPMTNADADGAQQVTDIQNLLVRNPSGLIVNPVDADAVAPAIDKAAEAGVPVVTVDRAPSTTSVYMVVRADNYGMGVLGCEAIGDALDGAGTVLNLQGALSSSAGLDRSNGFTDCMAEKYPEINVINEPTEWDVEKVTTGAQTVVSTQDVAGIFLASDSLMTPPIEATLKSLDKWHQRGEDGHIVIATVDGTPEALDMIRTGYFDTVVSQPVNDYAKYAVQYVLAATNGEDAPAEGATDHNSTITKLDGVLNDLLPAVAVTESNVDDADLWGNAAGN